MNAFLLLTSLLLLSSQTLRSAVSTSSVRRRQPQRTALRVERLEDRTLLDGRPTIDAFVDGLPTADQSPAFGCVRNVPVADLSNLVVKVYSITDMPYIQPFENSSHPIDPYSFTFETWVRPWGNGVRADVVDKRTNQVVATDRYQPGDPVDFACLPANHDVAPLIINQQHVGRIENAFSTDHWTFWAASQSQVDFDVINASSPGMVFTLQSDDGWNAFRDSTGDSDVITLPSSGQYELTAHSATGQTGSYAFRLVGASDLEGTPHDLELGTPFTGTILGPGQAQLFRVDVPTSQPMPVVLDDTASTNVNELYVRFGAPPTRADYDYRATAGGVADQQVLVPLATAGTWYILVYSESVPVTSDFTLAAETAPLILRNVTPDHLGNNAPATLTLSGAGFDSSTIAELVGADATAYPASKVELDSFTQITASFGLSDLPVGDYSVRVRRPGAFDTWAKKFTVLPASAPKLDTRVIVPSAVGRHALATLYVEYANTGNLAMPAPLLILKGSDRAFLTLDESRIVQGFWTSAVPDGFNDTVQFLASGSTPGVLQPGESIRVPVCFAGLQEPWDLSDNSVEFDLRTITADDSTPIEWNALKAGLRPPGVDGEAWEALFANLVAKAGATSGSYVRMLGENASYLARLGETVLDVSQLWSFAIQQANGLNPLQELSGDVDLALPAPGLTLSFGRTFSQPITGTYTFGPLGRGWFTPWQTSLEKEADGSVNIIGRVGSRRRFQPDSRGGFFSAAGDYATLTEISGGGYLLQEPDGLETAFRQDGKLDYVQDTNGNRITAGHAAGRLTSLTHSAGPSLTLNHNAAGLIQTVHASDGREVTFTYDATNQHLIAVRGYDGQTTRYTYSTGSGAATEHALLSVESPGGRHRFFTYDAQGRLLSTSREGNAEQVIFGYDFAGRVSVTDAAGNTGHFYFDHRGLLLKTVDPLGRLTYSEFDGAFNLTRITDATGQSQVFTHDARGNLTRAVDQLGNATFFRFTGPFNQLTSFTDARANTTQYSHDTAGNLLTTTFPDNSVERWGYDPLGNALSFTNRRGQVIGYAHNPAGQVTRQSFDDGSHVDIAYDVRGHLESATDASGVTSFEHDPAARLTKVTYPTGRFLEFFYDMDGRRTRMVDQDGFTVKYAYNGIGRLSKLTDGTDSLIVRYLYDVVGRLSRKEHGNGTYATFEYDAAGQLLHLVNHAPNGSINSRFDYSYDSLGRRVSMATLDGQWSYRYDGVGQLVRAVFTSTNPEVASQDLTYVYDALGNRIRTIDNGVTTEYTTNNLNQYANVGSARYSYDADGNMITKIDVTGTSTYAYDTQNRLVRVVTPEGTWDYEYDAFGNRTATVHNSQRTEYALDPLGLVDVVAAYDVEGSLLTRYVHGLGLTSRIDGGSTSYYDFDANGNTIAISNQAGQYRNAYAYLPFGDKLEAAETLSNPFTFVGEFGVMDGGNGQMLMRERHYQPELGVFVSEDPLGIPTQGLHVYANNNPISLIDPTGLKARSVHISLPADQGLRHEPPLPPGPIAIDPDLKPPDGPGGPPDDKDNSGPDSPDYSIENWNEDSPEEKGSGPLPPLRPIQPKESPVLPALAVALGSSGVAGSIDPNEKTGPAGPGVPAFISPDNVFPYRIDFENKAEATAPAQRVQITDQLDSDLDWTTFELTEIGFGDHLIRIPAGSRHYQTNVVLTANGRPLDVQIEAGLRSDSGQVYVLFQSIDPQTELPPDVLTGFLPPEDGTGRGQGHVSYVIAPKHALAAGTEIRNLALITFDVNPAIATNEVLNTIDDGRRTTWPGGSIPPPATGTEWLHNQQVPNAAIPTVVSDRVGLVSSYIVPSDDPAFPHLHGRSWVYDDALAVVANAMEGKFEDAKRVAQALAGLVDDQGKLGFSYQVNEPWFHQLYRTGAIAWVGYALVFYQRLSGDSQFQPVAERIGKWILSMQDFATGSVKGGPDVPWISTEHNIDAYFFLRDLGVITSSSTFQTAAQRIKASLLSNHWNASYGSFQQGINDTGKALDAASWGAIFLSSIGEMDKAKSCLDFLEQNFAITLNTQIGGTTRIISGYRPYPATNTIWSEGSLGVALAYLRVGNRAKHDAVVEEIGKMQGPLGGIVYASPKATDFADRESVAGTAWMAMVQSDSQLAFWSERVTTMPSIESFVAGDGQMFVLATGGQLWRYRPSDNNWLDSGFGGTAIAVSNTGDGNPNNDIVFVVDNGGRLWYWSPTSTYWTFTGGYVPNPVAGDNQMFSIGYDGQIWQFHVQNGWRASGGYGAEIVVASVGDGISSNDVVGLRSHDSRIWVWTQTSWTFTGGYLPKLVPGDNQFFGVGYDNQVWRYRVSGAGAGWLASGGWGSEIVIGNTGDSNPANDLVWLRVADNSTWLWTQSNWQNLNQELKQLDASDYQLFGLDESNHLMRFLNGPGGGWRSSGFIGEKLSVGNDMNDFAADDVAFLIDPAGAIKTWRS